MFLQLLTLLPTIQILGLSSLGAPIDSYVGSLEIWLIEAAASGLNTTTTEVLDPTEVLVPTPPPSLANVWSPSFAALSSVPRSPATIIVTETVTEFLTDITVTMLMSAAPTVTEIIAISLAPTATSTITWAEPSSIADLGSFNISHFASGQSNLEIVNTTTCAPPSVSEVVTDYQCVSGTSPPSGPPLLDSPGSILQLSYPAGSVDPKHLPLGGAEFYATPLDISDALNVTLEYCVFFPVGFNWVRGGKLPGLYGGHTECSGGNDALQCFSTRLMWRANGAGELYLYAPKTKQTEALCNNPQSVCDKTYGLSIGRGSFYFTPGAWTCIRQTVTLNTPGEQDGSFVLEVDGRQVINRTDIFYRDTPLPLPVPSATTTSQTLSPQSTGYTHDPLGGIFGPLIGAGSLLDRRINHGDNPRRRGHFKINSPKPGEQAPVVVDMSGVQVEWDVGGHPGLMAAAVTNNSDTNVGGSTITEKSTSSTAIATGHPAGLPQLPALPELAELTEVTTLSGVVSFTGLFFSTFFGGHEEEYSTPTNQYTWFKNFTMTRNG